MGCNHEESWNDSSTPLNPVPSDTQHRVLSTVWNSTGILSNFHFNSRETHILKTFSQNRQMKQRLPYLFYQKL